MNVGDIYLVNLDPTVGDEIKKSRPVVIVNPGDEKNLKLAIIVPVTSFSPNWEENPFFVIIVPDDDNKLLKKSAIDCFQIRAISHSRFIKKTGFVGKEKLEEIKCALSLILDIDPENCV